MSTHRLNVPKLYRDLQWSLYLRQWTWQDLANATGVGRSAFTRMQHGNAPSAHHLLSLLAWLGQADSLSEYMIEES